MQIVAKLVQVMPAQTGSGKNGDWRKQEIIVETDGQFPKKICISVWGDKLNNIKLNPGEMLSIDFDVESREYNSKWYTDVKAWRVAPAGAAPTNPPQSNQFQPRSNSGFPSSPPAPADDFDGDLPF